jgi:hypothetical protein
MLVGDTNFHSFICFMRFRNGDVVLIESTKYYDFHTIRIFPRNVLMPPGSRSILLIHHNIVHLLMINTLPTTYFKVLLFLYMEGIK